DEAAKFQSGDFSDPEAIHGSAMPGLAVLQERFDEVDVALLPHRAGATLTYTATDADVIGAIHAWFDAQVADHGSHAEHADE
ncbi:MAG: aspartate carbamoyltransferase, partial [Rhodothermales bacterium]|nr:aspartate carbamoyltransferase [Rhodothermales bacterium]